MEGHDTVWFRAFHRSTIGFFGAQGRFMKTGTIAVVGTVASLAAIALLLFVSLSRAERTPRRASMPAITPPGVPAAHETDGRPIRSDTVAPNSAPSVRSIASALAAAADESAVDIPVPPTPQDQLAYADSVFAQETTDVRWARETERTVAALFQAAAANAEFEITECRTTMCKVQSKHTSEQQFQSFTMGMAEAVRGWRGAFYSVSEPPTADGTVRNTIFLAKEGHDMPTLHE